jgi:hypothetical protein
MLLVLACRPACPDGAKPCTRVESYSRAVAAPLLTHFTLPLNLLHAPVPDTKLAFVDTFLVVVQWSQPLRVAWCKLTEHTWCDCQLAVTEHHQYV